MKNNRLCRLLFSIFLGVLSMTHITTANAGSVSDDIIAAANALVPDARERLITDCRTITQPGAYSLIRNLSSTGDCLIVNADHVTIDLNGFVISGTGASTGLGISGDISQGLHVKNGTITRFLMAIVAHESNFVTLDEMKIIDTGGGVALGDGARVTNSIFAGNKSASFALSVNRGASVKDNTFYGNEVNLGVGAGSIVINNVSIDGDYTSSIGEKSLVIGNNISGNMEGGVRVGTKSNIIDNNTYDNGTFDMALEEPSNAHGNSAGLTENEGFIPGREFNNLFLTD